MSWRPEASGNCPRAGDEAAPDLPRRAGGRPQPQETIEVDHLVRKIADSGVTVVLVEHDMKMVMNLSDRILVLDYGKKLAEGTGEEVRKNPDVIAAYLGAHA